MRRAYRRLQNCLDFSSPALSRRLRNPAWIRVAYTLTRSLRRGQSVKIHVSREARCLGYGGISKRESASRSRSLLVCGFQMRVTVWRPLKARTATMFRNAVPVFMASPRNCDIPVPCPSQDRNVANIAEDESQLTQPRKRIRCAAASAAIAAALVAQLSFS